MFFIYRICIFLKFEICLFCVKFFIEVDCDEKEIWGFLVLVEVCDCEVGWNYNIMIVLIDFCG